MTNGDHKGRLKKLADSSPNKKNGSPQFPDDGLGAHTVHTGRKGGNKIDNKLGSDIGREMLAGLSSGQYQIVSVIPPDYADPKKLADLNTAVGNGTVHQKKVITSEIAEDGQPRTKSLDFTFADGPIQELQIVYKLPSN